MINEIIKLMRIIKLFMAQPKNRDFLTYKYKMGSDIRKNCMSLATYHDPTKHLADP